MLPTSNIMENSSDDEQMSPKYQESLKFLYEKTVSQLSEFYDYSDDWLDVNSNILNLNTELSITIDEMKKWLETPGDWQYTKDKERSLPGYYGELLDYDGELVDNENKRILYVGGNRHRGLYTNFNVFISAKSNKLQYLALLMNKIMVFDRKEVEESFIKFTGLPFSLDISIHPFQLDDNVSIGLLFSYYCEGRNVDKVLGMANKKS